MGCASSKAEKTVDEPSGTTKAGKANTRVDATEAAAKPVQGRPVKPRDLEPATRDEKVSPSRVCLRRLLCR